MEATLGLTVEGVGPVEVWGLEPWRVWGVELKNLRRRLHDP
jgi:hypothetical protein